MEEGGARVSLLLCGEAEQTERGTENRENNVYIVGGVATRSTYTQSNWASGNSLDPNSLT